MIERLIDYYKRHGFWETVTRAILALKRALFAGREVVFYCDLGKLIPLPDAKSYLKVELLYRIGKIRPQDLQQMTAFWNPKQAHLNIQERFYKGASLWLVKSGDKLAGYGWTIQGRTVAPYYFPLGWDDVHLFDFHVFPEYRGQGINPFLVTHILSELARSGGGRAYIEAAEWNQAQLSSLGKTPFIRMGLFRSFTVFGHVFVLRTKGE
jgi:ribosomal protein S18 acetylase RimI-like enzyme